MPVAVAVAVTVGVEVSVACGVSDRAALTVSATKVSTWSAERVSSPSPGTQLLKKKTHRLHKMINFFRFIFALDYFTK